MSTKNPFQLAENFANSELDKGIDALNSHARLCGVLEARLGLVLNTLRAHRPEAYELLVKEYDWGE